MISWKHVFEPSINYSQSWFRQYLLPSLYAIREGMIWLIPCLLISSFCLLAASIAEFVQGYRPDWVASLYLVHSGVSAFFPYLMTATISYVVAMQWRLPRPPVALLSILYLVLVDTLVHGEQVLLTFKIVMAITTPLYSIPLLAKLLHYPSLKLTRSDSAGSIVKESLNLVLPALITSVIIVSANIALFSLISNIPFLSLFTLDYANSPAWFGVIFAALNSILWFFGVHGYYALLPLVEFLQEAVNLNYSTVVAGGEAIYHMNLSFMGAFVFIGGSGATLSLVIALLLFAKHRNLKLIAIASIPIGLLNINEILLFGLPIIFNLRLFLPFLICPIANVLVSMLCVSSGWVASPSVSVPFNSPIFFNAFVATGGDFSAVVLQSFNIALGVMIYYPAVKYLYSADQHQSIHIAALDTTFSRREEEARSLVNDPIKASIQAEFESKQLSQQIELLSRQEFVLEYQPQICTVTNKVVGCEALVRAIDEHGHLKGPQTFMPWLEKANLMKDLDLWVIKQAVKDIAKLQSKGHFIPVSVNITPETLISEDYFERIVAVIKPYARYLHFELTEETLLLDKNKVYLNFNRLHQLGVKIHIDDFGTGYSSLSYLNQFTIDCIKIDRSFVLALSSDKGVKVFDSILSIANQLDLDVIVEGVETIEQLNHVPKRTNIKVQGWYYSKSLALNELVQYNPYPREAV
ncbi:EAL domain-containing protein [Vibrio tubiashii]|uniref:PTS sugar transporter subunit IIC/EAL domain-containing protein n=1 Tax=Vibrio tubiashii TaxID=29498 RepID=UPI00234E5779|nr:EAL domain-containing protein [Vibrio tubiashii]WCP68248.1 EAL domain-containing protein [Vibrio tubiashii]